jgi:TonB family protein
MIALVMLAAVVCATTAGAAAWSMERAARLWRRPTRWAWAAALVAAAMAPVLAVAPWRSTRAPVVRTAAGAAGASVRLPTLVVTAGGALDLVRRRLGPDVRRALARADRPLGVAWALASALTLLTLGAAHLRLRRRARAWPRALVDGVPVRIAPDLGPAVVGVRRSEIVLAEWTLALDAPLRALVLRHEAEHVRAGDARLLAGAALLIAAMPWNAPLWWLAHRLRLALEVDCDARVLRAHPDVRRYGLLLLTVAQRAAGMGAGRAPLAPAALAEPITNLERRIEAMRSPIPTHRVPRTLVLGAAATLAVSGFALACATPEAISGTGTRPGGPPRTGVLALDSVVVTPEGGRAPRATTDSTVYFEFQVERPVTQIANGLGPRYPDSLRTAKVEGDVLVQFVVDTTGLIQLATFKVLKSSHQQFTEAVRTGLSQMRFAPALVGGRKVRQLVQQPFQFAQSR